MLLKIVACELFFREICYCASRSTNHFDFDFLSQGYHDNPIIGRERIQEHLDAIEAGRFDAILVGYGLCSNMLNGLRAPDHTPMVIPRAHDCITFFLGSQARYNHFFLQHPGSYYFTTGWIEHRERGGERPERKQGAGLGMQMEYDALVEKYSEDNAEYLLEVMDGWSSSYERGVYIDFDFSHHLPHREHACAQCANRGWKYQEVDGDLSLFQRWLDGDWPDGDFLHVPPGRQVRPSYDDGVIRIAPAPQSASARRQPGGGGGRLPRQF